MKPNHALLDMRQMTESPRQHAPQHEEGEKSMSSRQPSISDTSLNAATKGTTRGERGGEFLTVEQVAFRLGVTRNWVYTHAGELGVYRLGKYLRFTWSRVLQQIEK